MTLRKPPLYKANISLIMLFVLGIGSLIGLMSTGFVQDMITSSSQIRDFYQSYYIAKGGIELGVLIANKYEYGFEDHLIGGEALIADNLKCGSLCTLDLKIESRIQADKSALTKIINKNYEGVDSCSSLTPHRFNLKAGESVVYPLFADQRKISHTSNASIQNIVQANPHYNFSIISSQAAPIGLGVVLGKTNEAAYENLKIEDRQALIITGLIGNNNLSVENLLYKTPKMVDPSLSAPSSIANAYNENPTPTKTTDYYNYIYITNLSQEDFAYCLGVNKSEYGFVGDESIITSVSNYNTTQLGLQALVKKPLLEYIVRPYIQ